MKDRKQLFPFDNESNKDEPVKEKTEEEREAEETKSQTSKVEETKQEEVKQSNSIQKDDPKPISTLDTVYELVKLQVLGHEDISLASVGPLLEGEE